MKSRTRTYKMRRAVKARPTEKKTPSLRWLAWALVAAFGLLLFSHVLSGCTPTPAQAQTIQVDQKLTDQTQENDPIQPTPKPAPTRAHPRQNSPKTRVAIISTGYQNGTVNLRACPSTACAVVSVLAEGTAITVASGTGEPWRQILSPAGAGWLYKNMQYMEVEK